MKNTTEENLKGFKRKLMEVVGSEKADDVLKLIPNNIMLPLFYVGDKVRLVDGGEVIITDMFFKNGRYAYYHISDEYGEVYSYEDEFVF